MLDKTKQIIFVIDIEPAQMLRSFIFFFLSLLSLPLFSQLAEDFTVTDYNNVDHSLYADHLDQGQTVVIKIFFTSCPPCQAQAPGFQEFYENWGSGTADVEFFEISNKSFDSNNSVKNYANTYGTDMPGVGKNGGSLEAIEQFTSGTFGPFFGTPTYAVIAPDGTVQWDVGFAGIETAIENTGAIGPPPPAPATTTYNIFTENYNGSSYIHNTNTQYIMGSDTDPNYELDISSFIINGSFEYPSLDIPEVDAPHLKLINNTNPQTGLSPLDLIIIQKHLLQIDLFTNDFQYLAADINNSGSITPLDLIELQKVILEINTSFNQKDFFQFYIFECNNCQQYTLPFIPNGEHDIHVTVVQTGNVN